MPLFPVVRKHWPPWVNSWLRPIDYVSSPSKTFLLDDIDPSPPPPGEVEAKEHLPWDGWPLGDPNNQEEP